MEIVDLVIHYLLLNLLQIQSNVYSACAFFLWQPKLYLYWAPLERGVISSL